MRGALLQSRQHPPGLRSVFYIYIDYIYKYLYCVQRLWESGRTEAAVGEGWGGPLEQPPLPSVLSPHPVLVPFVPRSVLRHFRFRPRRRADGNRISHPPIWILYFFIIKYK